MRASEFISEGNDREHHTGGSLGLPFPGTYEQEYNKFKRKGPRRITAMTNEDTITLTQIYKDSKPDRDEAIWDYGEMIWDENFEIQTINPNKLGLFLLSHYGVEHIDELFDKMTKSQSRIVKGYTKDPNLSNQIIIMDDGYIVDGNHRALAAVLANKPIKFINISEEDQ